MGKTKDGVRHQSVSLAVPFIEEIKKHIINDPKYRSIADYVRESVREKMQNEICQKNAPHFHFHFDNHPVKNQVKAIEYYEGLNLKTFEEVKDFNTELYKFIGTYLEEHNLLLSTMKKE